MLHSFLRWWEFNFWLGLACTAAGVLVVLPFLLSRRFRRRFPDFDAHLEAIGLLAIILSIAIIAIYNGVGQHTAP